MSFWWHVFHDPVRDNVWSFLAVMVCAGAMYAVVWWQRAWVWWLVWSAKRVGYWVRPYNGVVDRRVWWWQVAGVYRRQRAAAVRIARVVAEREYGRTCADRDDRSGIPGPIPQGPPGGGDRE
jgi:hypothetical protein